jgi:hypothetical protein
MLLLWFFMSLAFATDMSGIWQTEDNTTFLIPFMRDGDIPIVLKKGKVEDALWGRWSLEDETLTITVPTGDSWVLSRSDKENQLLFQKGTKSLTLNRRSSFPKRVSDGIWSTEAQGEFIPVLDGEVAYVIHQSPSQETKLYKGKVLKDSKGIYFTFKAKKKCHAKFYKKDAVKAEVTCGKYIDEWDLYFKPTEMPVININGLWKFDNILFHAELDRFQWNEANIEYPNLINVYKGKWAAGSMGTKFYLEKVGLPSVIGNYSPTSPNQIILTIEGKMMIFIRDEF